MNEINGVETLFPELFPDELLHSQLGSLLSDDVDDVWFQDDFNLPDTGHLLSTKDNENLSTDNLNAIEALMLELLENGGDLEESKTTSPLESNSSDYTKRHTVQENSCTVVWEDSMSNDHSLSTETNSVKAASEKTPYIQANNILDLLEQFEAHCEDNIEKKTKRDVNGEHENVNIPTRKVIVRNSTDNLPSVTSVNDINEFLIEAATADNNLWSSDSLLLEPVTRDMLMQLIPCDSTNHNPLSNKFSTINGCKSDVGIADTANGSVSSRSLSKPNQKRNIRKPRRATVNSKLHVPAVNTKTTATAGSIFQNISSTYFIPDNVQAIDGVQIAKTLPTCDPPFKLILNNTASKSSTRKKSNKKSVAVNAPVANNARKSVLVDAQCQTITCKKYGNNKAVVGNNASEANNEGKSFGVDAYCQTVTSKKSNTKPVVGNASAANNACNPVGVNVQCQTTWNDEPQQNSAKPVNTARRIIITNIAPFPGNISSHGLGIDAVRLKSRRNVSAVRRGALPKYDERDSQFTARESVAGKRVIVVEGNVNGKPITSVRNSVQLGGNAATDNDDLVRTIILHKPAADGVKKVDSAPGNSIPIENYIFRKHAGNNLQLRLPAQEKSLPAATNKILYKLVKSSSQSRNTNVASHKPSQAGTKLLYKRVTDDIPNLSDKKPVILPSPDPRLPVYGYLNDHTYCNTNFDAGNTKVPNGKRLLKNSQDSDEVDGLRCNKRSKNEEDLHFSIVNDFFECNVENRSTDISSSVKDDKSLVEKLPEKMDTQDTLATCVMDTQKDDAPLIEKVKTIWKDKVNNKLMPQESPIEPLLPPDSPYIKMFNDYQYRKRFIGKHVLYVNQIVQPTTVLNLKQRFEKFGTIEDIHMHSRPTGVSYAFITYKSIESVTMAMKYGNDDPDLPKYEYGMGGRREKYRDLDFILDDVDDRSQPVQINSSSFDELLKDFKTHRTNNYN